MSETSDTPANDSTQNPFDFDRSKGNFSFPERHKFDAGYGLTEATIDYISDVKDEPDWIRHFRKNALAVFESKPMPTHWASPEIEKIDFSQIRYYLSDGERPKRSWEDVPEDVKRTFERLGVPEQERQFLAGVEAQYDSESAYSNMKEELRSQGVIFVNSTEGLKNHEEIFRQWFGKVIPTGDNKFSALNSAAFRKRRPCPWRSTASSTISYRNSRWNIPWNCAGSLTWKWKTASDKGGNDESIAQRRTISGRLPPRMV